MDCLRMCNFQIFITNTTITKKHAHWKIQNNIKINHMCSVNLFLSYDFIFIHANKKITYPQSIYGPLCVKRPKQAKITY